MSLSSLLSIIFVQMNHPLAMGLILLIQTTLISTITGMMSYSFWFSYILFLIFLGGMLVLFIYVASLASNELFSLSTNMIIISTVFFMMIMLWSMNMSYPNLQNQDINEFLIINNNLSIPLIKLYNQPTSIITIMLALYLFLTLIAVVKITNIFEGPLRQMN
uniref:NADH-ubiquinone oxidoreductase chain 6 n=1 Tax=Schultesia lampyridiformis TaxID=36965 RepID=A0A2P1H7T9_SCHLA|nr:NADH dehydrogenase subunit 6 [Schultesia lampyridiformis]